MVMTEYDVVVVVVVIGIVWHPRHGSVVVAVTVLGSHLGVYLRYAYSSDGKTPRLLLTTL